MAVSHDQKVTAGHRCVDLGFRCVGADHVHLRGDVARKFVFAGVDPGDSATDLGEHPDERAADMSGAEQHDLKIARCDRVEKKERRIGALIESPQPRAITPGKMLADRSQGVRVQQILVTVHAIRRHDRFACAVATRGR